MTQTSAGPLQPHALIPTETSPPSVLTAPPTPLSLLVALRRRWFVALILGLIAGAAAAAAAWYVSPISWRANTRLQIMTIRPSFLFDTPESRIDFANYQRSQAALAK